MRKNLLIFAVLVTAAALVAGSFALPAMAAESATPVTETAEQTGVSVVSEDVSLRGEYEKHFLMSDGSYQAVVYSEPVHELVDGAWVEITSTNQNARDSATTDNTKSNIIDNYVLQGGGVQNKSLDRLYIGNRSAGLTRAYIQFATMPTIPEGSTITSATMTLHLTSGTSTAANASAYMVTGGEWTSGTIQWSNMPAANVLLQGDISHNNVTGYTFSCLSAVQTWYNGDPTGQHNNYGIMLKYANESIDDYNAVYSADYTDANKRPKLTISYTISQVSVVEGYIKKLPFSETTETITWASSDTGIAIATSGGNVIGVKAGTAIVTGTVNGEVMYTYTVHVVIADGVYYIKSSNGLYLGTSGSIAEYTPANLLASASTELGKLFQLWRVRYIGNGYYSIRPMHEPSMGLHVTSNSVDITTTVGSGDSLTDVTAQNRWSVVAASDGKYYINNVGTYTMGLTYPNGVIMPGMSVITGANSGTSDSFKWELIAEDDLPQCVVMYNLNTKQYYTSAPTFHINARKSKTLMELNMKVVAYCNGTATQSLSWSVEKPQYATVDVETGTVTAVAAGTTEVYGTIDMTGDGTNVHRVKYNILVDSYLGELECWYDDEQNEQIGKWDHSPKIYLLNLYDGSSEFYFNTATSFALNQWNSALGLTMEFEADQSSADIICYGGTYEILTARNVPIGPLDYGLTWFTDGDLDDLGEYYTYGENEVTLLHIDRANCAIMYSGGTENQDKKTAVHELGHALGFFGHITDSTAIMKQGRINIYELTDEDIDHLAQVYLEEE